MNHRHYLSIVASLAIAVSLGSCSQDRDGEVQDEIDQFGEYLDDPVFRFEPFQPYPEAAEVRLFVWDGSSQIPPPTDDPNTGIPITGDNRSLADQSIMRWITVEPGYESVDACRAATHVLAYYDDSGTRLGQLEFTFHCRLIWGSPPLVEYPDRLEADWPNLIELMDNLGQPTLDDITNPRHEDLPSVY